MNNCHIAVIGGGPSGLTAAITAARNGKNVIIIEAQQRVGRKLLSTGNGRCNIANISSDSEFWRSRDISKVCEILNLAPLDDVKEFLASVGIRCREESGGRLYPRSEQASGVLDMLRYEVSRLGIEVLCESRVASVSYNGVFSIQLENKKTIKADKVIAAFGGAASPQLGGCSDGYRILKKLGHSVTEQKPALLPLCSPSPILKSLKGTRVHCDVSLLKNGRTIRRESGELQFTDTALSGIAVFQLSATYARTGGNELSVDLFPEYEHEKLLDELVSFSKKLDSLPASELLSGLVNKRVSQCVIKSCASLTQTAGSLSKAQLENIAKTAKDWRFPITGPANWKQAQVTSGGVSLSEFDNGLRSRIVPDLFACGEVLDCDGDCGGFNLRWAWSSGLVAGRSASKNQIKG